MKKQDNNLNIKSQFFKQNGIIEAIKIDCDKEGHVGINIKFNIEYNSKTEAERCPKCNNKQVYSGISFKKCKVCGHRWDIKNAKKIENEVEHKIGFLFTKCDKCGYEWDRHENAKQIKCYKCKYQKVLK